MSKRRFIELLILFYQGMTSERKKEEDRSKSTKICSEKKTRLIEQKLWICVSETPAQGKFWDPKPFSKFSKILIVSCARELLQSMCYPHPGGLQD